MEGRFLLDVVVREGAAVLELLAREDEALLIRRNAFLILNLLFNVLDRVGAFHFERDRLSSQRFHEDLHPTTQTEHQMEGRFLLDVIIGERSTIFELLAREDEALLIGRDAFLVLYLLFYVLDSVGAFYLESDRFASESLYEDLHSWSNSSLLVVDGTKELRIF